MANLNRAFYEFIRKCTLPFLKITGVGAAAEYVLMKDSLDKKMFCRGTTVPSDSTAGYAKGCLFIKTDQADGSTTLYENTGTSTLCDFNLVADTTPVSISLADGKVLIGGGDGNAAPQTISGDITTTNAGVVTIGAKKVLKGMLALASGKLFVGQASGAAEECTPTGDVTFNTTGVFAIGAGKVTPAMNMVKTKTTENTDGSITVLAANLLNGYVRKTGCTAPSDVTFDTAVNIQAATGFNATAGSWFDFSLVNSSTQTLTLVAGDGNTVYGPTSIANNKVARIRFVNTGAGTIDVIVILTA